jgi:methionyl-tRNA formyltransferase
MKMDVGLDTGPMLKMKAVKISAEDTAGSLFHSVAQLGADLLIEVLPDYLSGKLIPQPQPAEGATYAPMLNKEDGLLDFTKSAIELERRVRALNPWPCAWMLWNGNPLKVLRASAAAGGENQPGSRIITGGKPAVQCAEGILILEELQPAGKKSMNGKAFLAGARDWVG